MIKVLIVDDEQSTINVLKEMLSSFVNYKVVGEALTLQHALELTCIEKPDLVLLDIVLGNKTGFDYINSFLPNINFKIIFISAYNEYAIKAFEYNAIHYLLKPIQNELFKKSLEKVENILEQKRYVARLQNLVQDYENDEFRFLYINTLNKIYKIDIKNTLYLKADGNYTDFYLVNNKKVEASKTLSYFEKQLDKSIFCRIHHSYLINILKVNGYNKKEREVILLNKKTLSIATRRTKSFLEMWCKLKKVKY